MHIGVAQTSAYAVLLRPKPAGARRKRWPVAVLLLLGGHAGAHAGTRPGRRARVSNSER